MIRPSTRPGTIRPPIRSALMLAAALCAVPALAQSTAFQLSSDEPVQIQADKLDVRDQEGRAIFTGNVEVVQGELSLRSASMVVHYMSDAQGQGSPAAGLGGAGDIERIEASGGVRVRSGEQVATGDNATFEMATEIVTLTGDRVVLTDAGNVITGCSLVIALKTGNATVEPCQSGRVSILLDGNPSSN